MSGVDSVGPGLFMARYQASMARSTLDQARQQGAQAVALIEGAAVAPSAQPAALPPGATISIHA